MPSEYLDGDEGWCSSNVAFSISVENIPARILQRPTDEYAASAVFRQILWKRASSS
ncbi:hypothetical protein HMPREF9622_01962 [Cutibacterium modestum HL037PA3]|nr:hypothetical protein HMPREF9622_01962 [Cutibacterium modestum HL037PA3]